MSLTLERKLDDNAFLALTKEGERALHEPGTWLNADQLAVLVLVDANSTVAKTVARVSGLSEVNQDAVRQRLCELVDQGLICVGADLGYGAIDPGDFFSLETAQAVAGAEDQARANADVSFLQKNGYCVNLARRSIFTREPLAERKLTVVIVDDDPNICSLLRMYLKLEGFEARVATDREEVVAAIRQAPPPDLVLLDVSLPDINGFNVLAKIREHPALKTVPVIMVTASATREAVLKGILGGADGYITKPFQIHPLIKAVKEVLGLKYDVSDKDWDFSH